jgi:hypothetical protein
LAFARAGLVLGAVALAAGLISGGTRADPRTPPALPGLAPPFLVSAVVGDGGRTEAIDAYGDVVGLWQPGPAGGSLIYNPADRQAASSVPADTGVVARAHVDGRWIPFWDAESVRQRYLPGTNTLRTVARFGSRTVVIVRSVGGRAAARGDRRWLARARSLGAGAPRWARAMYRRSLLVLRVLADRHTGAVAAGPREGWAYVWPRDASAVAMALAASGYRAEARRIVRFLRRLDLGAAARFDGSDRPIGGRAAQGDAAGWVAAAARSAGLRPARARIAWRDRADYQEGGSGDFLGDAIASGAGAAEIRTLFGTTTGLVHVAGDPSSGIDSAAAWAVRPFPRPALFPLVRRTLMRLAAGSTRFGLVPSEDWPGGPDPWTAPTAWTAWSLAALGERRAALRLVAELRRAATPTGLLPERIDVRTGVPSSTTPLAWSHAFAILALRQLWPARPDRRPSIRSRRLSISWYRRSTSRNWRSTPSRRRSTASKR